MKSVYNDIYILRQGCCFYLFNDSSAFRLLFRFQKQGIKNPLEIIGLFFWIHYKLLIGLFIGRQSSSSNQSSIRIFVVVIYFVCNLYQ